MKQMKISEQLKVSLNYEEKELSRAVKELQPVVFQDGNEFCCLLGPDMKEGIFGCGISLQEALKDWERNLEKRINNATEGDEVALYAIDVLKASNKKIW